MSPTSGAALCVGFRPPDRTSNWPHQVWPACGPPHRALLILGATAAADEAKPHVTGWLAEQAVLAARSTWYRFRSRETGSPAPRAEQAAAAEAAPPTETQELVDALEVCRASMSTEEARTVSWRPS